MNYNEIYYKIEKHEFNIKVENKNLIQTVMT